MNSTSPRRIALAAGVLSIAVVGAAGLASSALFTDSDTSTGNSFAAGTVDIATGGGKAVFSLTDLAPRSVHYASIDVSNDGSLQHRYAMSSKTSDTKGLGDQLLLKVAVTEKGATCDATAVKSTIFDGALSAASFGDATAGKDSGDRVLDAAGAESLCLEVTMPDSAGDNAFQGGTASTTFSFAAEQTLNN
jgi:spore coat-associated protein N